MSDECFVHTEKVKLKNKEEVVLPPLTLRKILAVTKGVANLVEAAKKEFPELATLFEQGDNPTQIGLIVVQKLPSLIPQVLGELTDVLATYLDKPKEYILDNFEIEDLVAVSTPFFANILRGANITLDTFNNAFKSEAQNSSEVKSQTVSPS